MSTHRLSRYSAPLSETEAFVLLVLPASTMNSRTKATSLVQHVSLRRRAHSESPDGNGAGLINKVFITLHVGLGLTAAPLVFSNETVVASPDHAQLSLLFSEI